MHTVVKYIPDRMYGFVADTETGRELYFHLGDFDPKAGQDLPVPPVVGEQVRVLGETLAIGGRPPRAMRVERMAPVVPLTGTVDTFNPVKGYGFVTVGGTNYHLHRSEITDGHAPTKGATVQFYAGERQGKPRACHATVG